MGFRIAYEHICWFLQAMLSSEQGARLKGMTFLSLLIPVTSPKVTHLQSLELKNC